MNSERKLGSRRRRQWVLAVCLGFHFANAGCQGSPELGEVAGEVKVDGKPAKTGSVALFPLDGVGVTTGGEIVDGQYRVERVPLGRSRVEIRVSKTVGKKKLYDTPDSPYKDLLAESLPPRFNDASELELDVQPGENRRDYDLSTSDTPSSP